MMKYCSTDKVYVKQSFQQAYIQIHYPQLSCPNPRILHVFLYVQVLALIAERRYICMKNKIYHHRLLCKGGL